MSQNLMNRKNFIIFFFIIVSLFFSYRLYNITIINGEYYREQSLNNRIKRIELIAKRGEILDRNGNLLAGNKAGFYVNFLENINENINTNEVAINLFQLLDENNEKHIEFPIQITSNGYEYIYDKKIDSWLKNNGFELNTSAEEAFNDLRQENLISESLDQYEAQRLLYLKGIWLPISVKTMEFTDEIDKRNFLEMYGIDKDTSAKEAFEIIRNKSYFNIDESYSDQDAEKILTLKHAINEQGYLKYQPITVAEDISHKTASLISEKSIELAGTTVEVRPIRDYPYKDIASQVIGYMGKIALPNEIEKFVEENNYSRNQLIGKTGIENKFELQLTGENGYKHIEIDAFGNYVKDVEDEYDQIDNKVPKSGEDINLTIDIELQEKLENYLRQAFKGMQEGSEFKSKWGDYNYSKTFEKAVMGAGVVVNVNTGEVLALANVPTFDLNLFSTGISSEDWEKLTPDNPRNPLAARPLYNVATRTAVQPGSTYKMVTGYAALDNGLNPNMKLYSNGYVDVGGSTYGCWLWNSYHGRHGLTNLYDALEVSCNYYFFNIANGYDYSKDRPLSFNMDSQELIDYTEKFGLGDPTGIEIDEVVQGVPDPERKKRLIKYYLQIRLEEIMEDYFLPEVLNNNKRKEEVINTIVSWADYNPSRGSVINNLLAMETVDDYNKVSELADIIKYDYFNLMDWYEGDTLNFAIGQGDHQYTPVQMVRYVAAIANGGKVLDLDVVKDDKIEVVNELNPQYIEDLKKGMLLATTGSRGSARAVFREFPIKVAGKTGTAEKEGRVPPLDEVEYLREHLNQINPQLTYEAVEDKTLELLIERNEEIAALEDQKSNLEEDEEESQEEIQSLDNEIQRLIQNGYLNKGYVMRQAIKDLSDKRITDADINEYRATYDNYSWFVSFAPYEDPEIAVAILIPQGGSGGYSAPVAREIIGDYFGLEPEVQEDEMDESN